MVLPKINVITILQNYNTASPVDEASMPCINLQTLSCAHPPSDSAEEEIDIITN